MKRKRTAVCKVVGRQVRAFREERGLTQADVAKAIGIHSTNVSHLEAGRMDLTVTQIERLASEFGVRVSDLLSPLDARAA